ncbi:MAG: 6-phosphogluconolactonase, partial [Bacteroidetes bacterium]
ERCVPPDHAESNYRMTVEHLLEPLGIPEYQIHRMRGEADPETEARRAGAEILEYVPGHNGLPRFDLLMLGMGTDGHTLSIFPHQMELLRDPRICAIGIHPESGQQRITLTGPVAAQAARIAFLVTGAAKAPIIQAIQEGLPESQHYPAAHIRAQSGELHWFMDVAAAG